MESISWARKFLPRQGREDRRTSFLLLNNVEGRTATASRLTLYPALKRQSFPRLTRYPQLFDDNSEGKVCERNVLDRFEVGDVKNARGETQIWDWSTRLI